MATPAALSVILTLILSSNHVELCDLYNLQLVGFVYFIIHASRAHALLYCPHLGNRHGIYFY